MTESRKLAAILAADVVGFSRLAGADEDRTLARLRALRSDLIDPTISVHKGRVVKRTGDGVLVEFRSVVDAVRCAIEVQNAMIDRNAGVPVERRIEFRIGIHLGDVVEESDGDLMGDGVNIAARLEGIAQPGRICLSEDAYRQVKSRLDLAISDLGETKLKNIAEPMRVFSLQVGGVPAQVIKAEASTRVELPSIVRPSVAVLTFESVGSSEGLSDFCIGLAADITTELSRSGLISVVARHESQNRNLSGKSVQEVGRILAVRYVLSGTVRRSGERGRMTAELLEVETGHPHWSERYDRSLTDIFATQDEITRAIVGVVEPAIIRAEMDRTSRIPAEKMQPHELLLRAWRVSDQGYEEGNRLAEQDCETVLRLDPENSDAQALLAHILLYAVQNLWTDDPAAMLSKVLGMAERASALNPKDYDAFGARGMALLAQGKYDAASRIVEELARRFPGHDRAIMYQALVFNGLGEHGTAFELIQRAIALNPEHDQWIWVNKGMILFSLERYAEAVPPLEQCRVLSRFPFFRIFLAAALAASGRDEDARAEADLLGPCAGKLTAVASYFFRDPTDRDRLIIWGQRAGLPA